MFPPRFIIDLKGGLEVLSSSFKGKSSRNFVSIVIKMKIKGHTSARILFAL